MMGRIRKLAVAIASALAVVPAWAADGASQAVSLRHQPAPGTALDVDVRLEVGGSLKILDRGKTVPLKMSTLAELTYEEKFLARPTAADRRSVRHYRQGQAAIRVEQSASAPALPEDRRLVVADAPAGSKPALYSPSGPFTRDELDLIDVPMNSLLLGDLCPAEPVKLGDTWQATPKVWALLLGLDAAASADVPLVFTQYADGVAVIEGEGRVSGAIGGISSEVELKLKGKLDPASKTFKQLVVAVKEDRGVGHIGPGLDVTARVKIEITPKAKPEKLADARLADVPLDPNPATLLLLHRFAGHSQFLHGRDWYMLNSEDRSVVLRLVKNGDLKGQCNVHVLTPVKLGHRPTAERFLTSIRQGLGEHLKDMAEVGEAEAAEGVHIHRAVAVGAAAELPIQWNYLLLTDPMGRQMVFTFTLEQKQVADFGRQDWEMTSTAEFIPDEKLAAETVKSLEAEKKAAAEGKSDAGAKSTASSEGKVEKAAEQPSGRRTK